MSEQARGQRTGRYRREELARLAGVRARNLRYYQERGLLPAPRREGRYAWYSDEHLARLRLIDRLLARGYTVNAIAELLDASARDDGLGRLLGLERELTRDWVREEPVVMTREELRDLFGPLASPQHTARAAELGYLTVDGEVVTHHSRRLLEATAALVREGVPLTEVLDAAEFVQEQAAVLADRFVSLFRAHVIGPEGLGRVSAGRVRELGAAVAALRPVAGEVVSAEFARAMARRVDEEVAELLGEGPGEGSAEIDQ
ncbi:MerR family transcriptional regulator [Streptomyces sp. BI20]|uniref:MerR family transcriptional regulator n=1 Tax=Streptomyces sp. BI20 TaxID=3403460 RepID=UPI003C735A97